MKYNNFHRHDHHSNIWQPDCIVKPIDYITRTLELNHDTFFTTQHGWTGNYLETYGLCEENNLKMIYGAELYIVKDRLEKDICDCHIIVIGKNQDAFYQLNEIISESNKTGFYNKPRIDLELILSLNRNNFIVTSACIAGILRSRETTEVFLEPIIKHFNNNFYFEVQSHPSSRQVEHNRYILNLQTKYNFPLIHGNDSHYIYSGDSKNREKFLIGNGVINNEKDFILDYPDYQTIIERYEKQNVLNSKQIIEALSNTLVFDTCEGLIFNKNMKIPSIYKNEDSNKKLCSIIAEKWKNESKRVNKDKQSSYLEGINLEYDIIKNTNFSNYFLLNEHIINTAITKYGGILARTGRGSSASFFINKLLGFTEIDRFEAEVPLYPTRFMSTKRTLESNGIPDIDFNWANLEAPIKAARDVLGEDGIYPMHQLEKLTESSSFINLCKSYAIPEAEYNRVAEELSKYRNDPIWKSIIEESQMYIGTIEGISKSPCSFLLLDKPVSKELGLIRVDNELCGCIDGYTADSWKFLKNDFFAVSSWKIVSDTFNVINKPIPNIGELKSLLDDKVWKLYEDGITATFNELDAETCTYMAKRYKPKSIVELSAFVAAMNPGFSTLVNTFLNRDEISTGVQEVDEIFKYSGNFMLYQESVMAFLIWCGIKEERTYNIIKKLYKKKFKVDELKQLKKEILAGYIKNLGEDRNFNDVWQTVEDAVEYSFNASHSLCIAWDSLYGAYLKANYPLEYYTISLNEFATDTEKTKKIIEELEYFKIKIENTSLGNSKDKFSFNKETNTIKKICKLLE